MSWRSVGGRRIRWDEEFARAAYSQGWWTRETLAEALRRSAENTPARPVLIDPDKRVDCLTLHREASCLARALLGRFPAGSVVSFILPNWHEAAVAYLGATLAGMVVNPILPSLRDRELGFLLENVDCRLVFIPGSLGNHDYRAMLERVTARLARPPEIVVVRGEPGDPAGYESLLRDPPAQSLPELDADGVRIILYTSGTTGTPKGVMHTHNSIHAAVRQIGRHWMVEPGDRFLVPSPVSHIGGSLYAFECPLLLGTTAVLMDRWDADAAVRLAVAERCTHVAAATPFLAQFLAACERAGARLPDLKLFACGGASVPPSLVGEAAGYFDGASVTRVYGSSEVPVTTIGVPDRADATHAAQTDGLAGAASIRITDAHGESAEEGEIRVKGPQMLAGYLDPRDELDAFDDKGFFRTGDLGRWADGKFLIVNGRSKDLIIRNGENISPKEIEDVLAGHPGISEIAVVGIPDARTGERACAVIVPAAAPPPDVAELRAYLSAQGLASFKIPEAVEVWDALPRNDAGKILKHQVRALLLGTGRGS